MNTKDLVNFYRRYTLIIWPFLSGIAAVVIIALVIVPQTLSYFQVKDEITKTVNNSSVLQAKAQELEQIDDTLIKQKLQTAFTILPPDQDVPKSAAILEALVRNSALELKSINFVSSGGKSGESFQLNITVSGPISLVRDFILGLKNSPQIFQVQSINVRFQQTSSVVDADIPLAVFYKVPARGQPSPDQSVSRLTREEEDFLAGISRLISESRSSGSAATTGVAIGKTDPFE